MRPYIDSFDGIKWRKVLRSMRIPDQSRGYREVTLIKSFGPWVMFRYSDKTSQDQLINLLIFVPAWLGRLFGERQQGVATGLLQNLAACRYAIP